ncbi:MAG: hypothetical protein R3E87_20870 [Burkholderiaceae bacterium]
MRVRRSSFSATLAVMFLATASAAVSAEPQIDPGAWGVTMQGDMADRMSGQMKMMEQELAKLPEAQQQQMRAMLAQQMQHMMGGEQETCITAADLKRGLGGMMADNMDEGDAACKHDIAWKGKVGTVSLKCPDGATGQGTITVDNPRSMVMQMRYKTPDHGEMNNVWKARWLRAACKPER